MKSIGKEALKAVAAKHGVSVEEVENDIAAAISYAKKSNDPQVHEQWKNMKDDIKPDEVIEQLVSKLSDNSKTQKKSSKKLPPR